MENTKIYIPKTILVAYSFGRNDEIGYSGIDRYSELLHKGMKAKHDTYAYGGQRFVKRLLLMPKAVKGYDLIHLTQAHGYEAFLGNNKAVKVLTWHDNMIFTRKSKVQFYNWIRGFVAYAKADIILFDSTQSYEELKAFMISHNFWKVEKECHVKSIPIADIWINEPIEKDIKREGFIYIGAIDYPHKNFKGLIECYTSICDQIPKLQMPQLHIFTSSANAEDILSDLGVSFDYPIIIHEREPDEKILKQLKKSIALLHLSLEEGYGLPIMESLAVGTPVITLKSARIPKEVAKWTIQTDYPDDEAIKLYNNPKPAPSEAIKHAKSLNKENYANEIVEIYEKAIK